MPHRPTPLLLALCLATLLAACTSGPTTNQQAWEGTTTSADGTFPLTVAVTLTTDGAWTGTYTVERTPAFTGAVDATLVAGVLEGVLNVSDDCRFALTGTVTADALEAAYAPTECPGGSDGTWTAIRTTPVPPASSSHPTATFGDAAFDAARFR
jgi:hypothetical protein